MACVYDKEPSGSIKDREFLNFLSECNLFKKDSSHRLIPVI